MATRRLVGEAKGKWWWCFEDEPGGVYCRAQGRVSYIMVAGESLMRSSADIAQRQQKRYDKGRSVMRMLSSMGDGKTQK